MALCGGATVCRHLVVLTGNAAAAFPSVATAQQAEGMRRVGVLDTLAADDQFGQERLRAFLQGLQEAGWSVGGNLRIDRRWSADGDPGTMHRLAAELVALKPDVILANGGVAVRPLLQATRSVPIVSPTLPTRSAPALSTAWRGPAVTPRDS